MSLQRSKNTLWPLKNRCSSSLVDLSDLVDNGRVEVMFRNALALVRFNLPANVASMRVTSATVPLAGAADMAFSDEPGAEGCLVFADDLPVSAENSTVTLLPPAGHDVFDTEVTYAMLVWPGVHQLDILLTDADGYVYLATAKYKVSDSVSKASDLEDGGMYFICANWDTNRCWYVADVSGTLRLSNSQPDLQGGEGVGSFDLLTDIFLRGQTKEY